jgi:Zn finger protein HypA/HybF involved in hydrogenase expression
MAIETFFTRPGLVCEIADRIKNDLKFAKQRILGATYSITEDDYVNLIKDSPVPLKKFVIHNEKDHIKFKDIQHVKLGMETPDKMFNMLLHHKFLIIDDILWVGSYNLSKNATLNNWENIMRITEISVVNQYLSEFKKMYVWGAAFQENKLIAYSNFDEDMNECNDCKKESCHKHKYIYCDECKKRIEDPFEHFRVNVQVVKKTKEELQDLDGEFSPYSYKKIEDGKIEKVILECIHKDESKNKLKCPNCGTFHWKRNLSRIEFYEDVDIHHQHATGEIWDEKLNKPIGTKPLFSLEKSEKRYILSKEMCLECLFDILEERVN